MLFKSKAYAAATAAALFITLAGAEGSGAWAAVESAPAIQTTAQDALPTTEVVPVFVAKEVVQELPEEAEAPATGDSQDNFDSLHALVAATPVDEALSEEMRCLAGAIYFESRGEPLAGQLAVGQVIINRTESGAFPSSYCGVVYQRSQFSFVKGGRMPAINTGSRAWKNAVAIARIAHRGLWDSEAEDALYFHATYVRPSWARQKIARATIDSHVFYR